MIVNCLIHLQAIPAGAYPHRMPSKAETDGAPPFHGGPNISAPACSPQHRHRYAECKRHDRCKVKQTASHTQIISTPGRPRRPAVRRWCCLANGTCRSQASGRIRERSGTGHVGRQKFFTVPWRSPSVNRRSFQPMPTRPRVGISRGGGGEIEEWAGGISNLRPQRPDGLVAITSL